MGVGCSLWGYLGRGVARTARPTCPNSVNVARRRPVPLPPWPRHDMRILGGCKREVSSGCHRKLPSLGILVASMPKEQNVGGPAPQVGMKLQELVIKSLFNLPAFRDLAAHPYACGICWNSADLLHPSESSEPGHLSWPPMKLQSRLGGFKVSCIRFACN